MRVGRTALGCLVAVAALVGLMLLVRPAIFTLAPPRDDSRVVIGPVSQLTGAAQLVDVALIQSRGLDGERRLGAGSVQVTLVASTGPAGEVRVVNAASPVSPDCPVVVSGDVLADCDGRRWALDGTPLDPEQPALQRFAAVVEGGLVIADLTRVLPAPGA